jgi:hypothetical protein
VPTNIPIPPERPVTSRNTCAPYCKNGRALLAGGGGMAATMIKPTRRPARLTLLLAALVSAVAACGAPTYTYVKNSNEHLYFKVPHEWRKVDPIAPDVFTDPVDPASFESAKRDAARAWQAAYDSDRSGENPDVLFGNDGKPFVYAQVRKLTEDQRDEMSINALRDLFLPVTDSGRKVAAQHDQEIIDSFQKGELSLNEARLRWSGLSGFELIGDRVLDPGNGIKGVRTVFNYYNAKYSDVLHTFDQTVLLSSDSSRAYLFVISCAAAYYREHFDQLNTIATSFTVRSR